MELNCTGFLVPGSSAPLSSFPGQFTSLTCVKESSSDPVSIAFIDARVNNPWDLIAGIEADLSVILDPLQNGIDQISEVLSCHQGVTRIDLITHGGSGELQLGSGFLNAADLPSYSGLLSNWRSSLADEADILIYGCNVATDETGQGFVNELSALTGADVAASTNLTGSSSRGGDWILEYATGPIDQNSRDFAPFLASYDGTLQTVFSSQSPSQTNVSDGVGSDWEHGMKFIVDKSGLINAIRFYKSPQETGVHTGKIWLSTGVLLATVVFTKESAFGWQQQALPTPLAVQANTNYVVSVNTNSYYEYTGNGFNTAISNGNLVAPVGAGVYNVKQGDFPSQTYLNKNYFRDVDFTPDLSPNINPNQVIDPNGSVRLLRDTTSNLVSVESNGVTKALTYQGVQLNANQFVSVGWQVLAAETIGGNQNQILWKELSTGRLHFWSVDSNWNYVSSGAIFDPSSAQGMLAQQQFMVDASGTPLNNQPPAQNTTNRPGSIAISGIASQNQTLTATVVDPDGVPVSINYQWQQSSNGSTWSNITGAIGRTLTLQQAQVGQQVRAIASYRDLAGTDETLNSSPTAAAVLNVNDPGVVSISGTPTQGQTLTATVVDPDGVPVSINYQWQQSSNGSTWSPISGAVGRTLTLQQAQGGQQVRVSTTYIDALGTSESNRVSTSLLVSYDGTPQTLYLSDLTPTASINGWGPYERDRSNGENGAADGRTLTLNGTTYAKGLGVHASSSLTYSLGGLYSRFQSFIGIDDEVPSNSGSVIFRVLADGVEIFRSGVLTDVSHPQFVDLDVAGRQTLQLIVDPNGSGVSDHADWAGAKLIRYGSSPVNRPGTISLSGTPTQGQALTATVADPDGLPSTINYQWQQSSNGTIWSAIAGATGRTLTLQQAQVGQQVRAIASYVDLQGATESLPSMPTATTVANVNDPGVVSISGTPIQGQTLTATVVDPDGVPGAINYQWQQSSNGSTWSPITGATGRTLTLQQAQVGLQVRAIATYTDILVGNETITSIASNFILPLTSGGQDVLTLPRETWWGGPSYYARFPKAAASGWADPSFFPIAVFFGKPSHAPALKAAGINTYMGAEHDGSAISRITSTGISVLAQFEWTPAEIGDDPRVVGWHISDEVDMGYSGGDRLGATEAGRLAVQTDYANRARSFNDGRFVQANFGNGVLGTFWAPNTMDDHLALVDASSVDKYAYTSPGVQYELNRSWYWPSGQNPASSAAYGWQQDRMELLGSQLNGVPTGAQKPNWVFVETAMPFLNEPGARVIGLEEIEGAVWNAIINGASGIAYFQHDNSGTGGTYSIIQNTPDRTAKITAINAQIARLAPVLNTQPYLWSFGSGLDTSLRVYGGNAYIFAMTTGGTGARTFTLPPGLSGAQVEVVDEGRSLTVTNGTFTDTFPAEHTHHIYRISVR